MNEISNDLGCIAKKTFLNEFEEKLDVQKKNVLDLLSRMWAMKNRFNPEETTSPSVSENKPPNFLGAYQRLGSKENEVSGLISQAHRVMDELEKIL